MTAELLGVLVRANLVLAAGVALVLLLRTPTRLWFGARIAYALWLIPPLAAAASLLPARTETVFVSASAPLAPITELSAAATLAPELPTLLLWVWAAGVALCLAVLALRQHAFVRGLGALTPRNEWGERVFSAQSAEAGPAVIGVLRPIIVTPADFESRYDVEERRIVLAHERAHLRQGDPLINALTALAQCAGWFNPLIHVGACALRIDQELACDAAVLAHAQPARRPYAETMLKAQVGAAVPLGCAWPPSSIDTLKERIAMLKIVQPSQRQRLIGGVALVATAALVCGAAWAAQPARVVAEIERGESHVLAEADVEVSEHVDTAWEEHQEHEEQVSAEIERAMEESREAIAEAERTMAEHEHTSMSQEEIRALTDEAMHTARAAMREAAAELERDALTHTDMDSAEAEIERLAQQMAMHAINLASLAMDGAIDDEAQRASEAEIERHTQRLQELSLRLSAEAMAEERRARALEGE